MKQLCVVSSCCPTSCLMFTLCFTFTLLSVLHAVLFHTCLMCEIVCLSPPPPLVLPQIPLGPMVVQHTWSWRLKLLNFLPQDQRTLKITEVQKVTLGFIYTHTMLSKHHQDTIQLPETKFQYFPYAANTGHISLVALLTWTNTAIFTTVLGA